MSDINELYGTQFRSNEDLFDSWKILHFSSKDKPWRNPFVLYADKWMEMFRSLPSQCRYSSFSVNQTKISVLVAVHNDKGYLRESLDSILHQTLGNIEIICIADDVNKNVANILRQYEQQDDRLSVVNGNGKDFGTACNSALAQSKGIYVFFLDDNMILPVNSLKKVWLTAEEYQADVTLLNGKRYDDRNRVVDEKSEFLNRKMLPQQPVFNREDIPNTLFTISRPFLWNKLYSRCFLLNVGLQFQNLSDFDDLYYACISMALAERIASSDTVLIYRRVNCASNIQQNKLKDPMRFLYAVNDLYQELIRQELFEVLQTAFRHMALSEVVSRLKNGKKNETRLQVLEALKSEPYCQLPLREEPEIDKSNPSVHWCSRQVTAACNWYCQSERISVLAKQSSDNWYGDTLSLEPEKISVSVIIPVYNSASYLDETLACITGQSLSDIEIICVNDGSTDNSLDILKRWAAKDDRFVILSQPNYRQGYARNEGIRHARGKYLYFMDSDDLLERQALEELIAIMEEKQLECLYFDGATFFDDMNLADEFARFESNYIRSRSYDDVYDGPTLLRLFCEENKFIPSPCMQIMQTDFVRKNRMMYPVGVIYEDNAFTFAVLMHAKRASHIQRAYFLRRIHRNSTMTSEITFQNVYGYYVVFLDMVRTYFEVADSLSEENRNNAADRIMLMLHNAQNYHEMLPLEYECSEWGMRENLFVFQTLVCDGGKRQIKKLNAQLNETRKTLQKTYAEKSEINRKLQITYAEKSEINRKLQITYGEKFDRGIQIKELNAQLKATKKAQANLKRQLCQTQKQLKEAKRQNSVIKRSLSYRLGRILTSPVRRLKRLWKKLSR